MLSDIPGLLNVALCTVIVLALFFYRRNKATHKPLVSWVAWLIMVGYAAVPLCFVFGRYPHSQWPVVLVNLLFCAVVLWARGNVSKILSLLRC
ncbi:MULTISPECIES: phage holin family protein [Cronobacter]|uniref:phage holin family protein n=2 Tax=Enterobacteriaceae TaxID=543 RepID=UPI0024C337EA|nr:MULTISPECIES: phage holin family protein [Cronobacter]MDK1185191.1 phage holin family protein [Cronobacter turicensis]MDK1194887.1 phage holin family protein [Cronobacter dublinensis]MDK1203964.1 phage holin family protein [Cronobacter dublinensis]MDK1207705.1 phage holin family protein [Cronobacter turicensis]MDK1216005.1 phage holin family protein [Cronobacter turicensis]